MIWFSLLFHVDDKIYELYESLKRRMLQIAWMEGSNSMPYNEFDIIYQVTRHMAVKSYK